MRPCDGWLARGTPPPTTNGDESSFSEGLSWTGWVGARLPGIPAQPLFPSTELPVTQSGVCNDPRLLPCLPPTTRQSLVQSGGLWASENREVGGSRGKKTSSCFFTLNRYAGPVSTGITGRPLTPWTRPRGPHKSLKLHHPSFLTTPPPPLSRLRPFGCWQPVAIQPSPPGFAQDFTCLEPSPARPWLASPPNPSQPSTLCTRMPDLPHRAPGHPLRCFWEQSPGSLWTSCGIGPKFRI